MPTEFAAVTVNVYEVPFVRPDTVQVGGGRYQVVVVVGFNNPFTSLNVIVTTENSND